MAQYLRTTADAEYGELWNRLRRRLDDDERREILFDLDAAVGERLCEAQDRGASFGPTFLEPGVPMTLDELLGLLDRVTALQATIRDKLLETVEADDALADRLGSELEGWLRTS